MEAYVRRNGFNDTALRTFVMGLIAHWGVYISSKAEGMPLISDGLPPWNAVHFIVGMWKTLSYREINELEELSEDKKQMSVWAETFKFHSIFRRYVRCLLGLIYLSFSWTLPSHAHSCESWVEGRFLIVTRTWTEICHTYLPNPEHAKLREKLISLEDIHGPSIRKRFPPKEGQYTRSDG